MIGKHLAFFILILPALWRQRESHYENINDVRAIHGCSHLGAGKLKEVNHDKVQSQRKHYRRLAYIGFGGIFRNQADGLGQVAGVEKNKREEKRNEYKFFYY